jgi:glycosyltransferase involved in cell wall biosynthesis
MGMDARSEADWQRDLGKLEATVDAIDIGPDLARSGKTVPSRLAWLAPQVTVVIPALNEAANLPYVLPRIPAWVHEVLIVDGESTDGTPEVARQLRPEVRIVAQDGRGKGAALRSGFLNATGEVIVMLDADGSMDPAEIPAFVGALMAGADLAKGSRFLQGGGTRDMPFYRKLGNGFFVFLANRFFGGRYSDLCYGYNAFWRDALPQLCLECDGFEVETVLNVRALRANWRVTEVPSFEAARVYGSGRLRTIPDGWRVLKSLLREAFDHYTGREIAPALEVTAGVAVREAV